MNPSEIKKLEKLKERRKNLFLAADLALTRKLYYPKFYSEGDLAHALDALRACNQEIRALTQCDIP